MPTQKKSVPPGVMKKKEKELQTLEPLTPRCKRGAEETSIK
jgi:hypothetical protein